jgi:hypothetical protein
MSPVTTKMQEQVKTNGTTGPETAQMMAYTVTAEDVKAYIEAQVQAKLQQILASPPAAEIAEPLNWWDGYAIGPIQPGLNLTGALTPGPLLPHQVIKRGEQAFVATVLILNPVGPGVPTALDILSNFALPYEIEYATGDVKRWLPGPAALQHLSHGHLVPGVAVYVDIFDFVAQEPSLYEMNICFRIFGCGGVTAPPFSGFATWVFDPDQDYLGSLLGQGGPGFYHKNPIRFQVYE